MRSHGSPLTPGRFLIDLPSPLAPRKDLIELLAQLKKLPQDDPNVRLSTMMLRAMIREQPALLKLLRHPRQDRPAP
ncbi:MAG: hypothetical protein ACREFP_20135 [Acetobacteraceae bacterium]